PTLLFPISPESGLIRLDLIRTLRMLPQMNKRLRLCVVFVNVKHLDRLAVVNLANEMKSLLNIGMHYTLSSLRFLKDDTGEWYEQLGRPGLPCALLVDSTGTILAKGVMQGRLDWETQRIDALLAGRRPPLSPTA